jgi:hypothetical protein
MQGRTEIYDVSVQMAEEFIWNQKQVRGRKVKNIVTNFIVYTIKIITDERLAEYVSRMGLMINPY